MEQIRGTSQDAVRARMKLWLDRKRIPLTEVAEKTEDAYKNVQRWVSGEVQTIPADFLGRFVAQLPVSPGWLLTGEGSPDVEEPSGDPQAVLAAFKRRLARLAEMSDDELLDEAEDLAGGPPGA